MPSYTQYKRQIAVLDADDSEIESWITVRGNHIPIMKGQSKGDAVKSFIESKKGGKSSAKGSNTGGKFEVIGGSGIKHNSFGTQGEAEKWAKENVNKTHTSLKVVSGYKKYKEYEPRKYSKPSDASKGGKKETKKYPQDLVEMAHSVMAYGGFGMKPEDILNDSYHGQYLKRYTEKYGKELVLETLKEMASRIDRVDYNVYTGSEGETYNSVIWKAPQLETLPDEEWEATLKKLYKDRGSEKKLSKPSDASGGGKKANVANELDDVFTGAYDVPEYVEKMRNIVDKHYSAKKVSDWERRSEGIQFFSDDTGRWGTTTEMSVDKELGDYILKAPSHRQEEVLRYLKDIFLENDRNGGWQVADPRDILGKLSSTKAKNGKYTFQINTSFYDMYHD